jgi:manganese oxidase
MAEMGMAVPRNSTPMVGGQGPFDYITMGGLFTVLKVREGITSYDDPGWYQHPQGTVASLAAADDLRRDGIELRSAPSAPQTFTHHHPG